MAALHEVKSVIWSGASCVATNSTSEKTKHTPWATLESFSNLEFMFYHTCLHIHGDARRNMCCQLQYYGGTNNLVNTFYSFYDLDHSKQSRPTLRLLGLKRWSVETLPAGVLKELDTGHKEGSRSLGSNDSFPHWSRLHVPSRLIDFTLGSGKV